ncbi:unnamed protein product [Timema podura]|uniref:Uncharacterized protein n=1 Tax=Timema podura TaxID=61482 RepID=A0ABN7PCT1_TIMPD|nr:unnamed protein product [Timema podura]
MERFHLPSLPEECRQLPRHHQHNHDAMSIGDRQSYRPSLGYRPVRQLRGPSTIPSLPTIEPYARPKKTTISARSVDHLFSQASANRQQEAGAFRSKVPTIFSFQFIKEYRSIQPESRPLQIMQRTNAPHFKSNATIQNNSEETSAPHFETTVTI